MTRGQQLAWVKAQLLAGHAITHKDLIAFARRLEWLGGHRLGALIYDLRKRGFPIDTRKNAWGQGEYSLAAALRRGWTPEGGKKNGRRR